jgi:hypothetical protein
MSFGLLVDILLLISSGNMVNLNLLVALAATAIGLVCPENSAFLGKRAPIHLPAQTRSVHPQQDKSSGGAASSSQPLTAPLDVEVPVVPWAFQANGKWHLVYELHLVNMGSVDCALSKIEVLNAETPDKPLASLAAVDLGAIIVHPGAEVAPPTTIPPAGFALAYMWVTIDRRVDVPAELLHRITLKMSNYPEGLLVITPHVVVDRDPVPVIDPPLRGPRLGCWQWTGERLLSSSWASSRWRSCLHRGAFRYRLASPYPKGRFL